MPTNQNNEMVDCSFAESQDEVKNRTGTMRLSLVIVCKLAQEIIREGASRRSSCRP